MSSQRRLIVCLDGTWNQQDSSTNVLHHFNLVREGVIPGTNITQKKYYVTGVGTGVLDGVTGGGFGFGLEKNVREAYNWLVENYCDGNGNDPPDDEIYIFGFSRGAYTARSLVGFIGQCGLLRRAAPITVNQLWADYCILGRKQEKRKSIWDGLFSKPEAGIRPITELVRDPWLRVKEGVQNRGADGLNESERLLVRWSRRVRITYLGVYDTVGAIGWDALAIPGLTSRMALHNNMRPTTIIQHCRHGLAMDEHRSSFNHTPFLAFVGHDSGEQESERGTEDSALQSPERTSTAKNYWDRTRAMWNRKIEQQWFVGAHSNIGGGYEDNRLAEKPLQWIVEGATNVGLVGEAVSSDPPVTYGEQKPRDSFAEFASPLWTKIIRAKPNYRLIDPDPLPQASTKKANTDGPPAGFSLQTINEKVDNSVVEYWEKSGSAMPPNLYEYAQRRSKTIAAKEPEHSWLGENVGEYVALVIWATLAAAGLAPLYKLIGLDPSDVHRLWGACLVAALLPLVDWSESKVNFWRAMGNGGPPARAFLDSIYWTRAFGFVFFLFGVVYSAGYLGGLGWQHAWDETRTFADAYWSVPVFAAAAAILASGFRSKAAWVSVILGPALTAGAGGLLVAVGWYASVLFRSNSTPAEMFASPSYGLYVPGLLLLLQLAFVYLSRATVWVAEPMSKANLGSIVRLQFCITPKMVRNRLELWRHMLECRWLREDPVNGPAAKRMREVLREALWRDIIGFIPVYSGVFLFGMWFAAGYCEQSPFRLLDWPGGQAALWWLVPLIAAVTDYAEDICHLRYLKLHEKGRQPLVLLTLFSFSMTVIKFVAVACGFVVTVLAIFSGTLQALASRENWIAKIAILISTIFVLAVVVYVVGLIWRFVVWCKARLAGRRALVQGSGQAGGIRSRV